jgi:hypothetical protein
MTNRCQEQRRMRLADCSTGRSASPGFAVFSGVAGLDPAFVTSAMTRVSKIQQHNGFSWL